MSQTSVADQLSRHRELARQAFDAREYSEAKHQARLALLVLAGVPNSEIRQLSRIEWDRSAIERFIRQVDAQQREDAIAAAEASGQCAFGLESCPVEYKGAG